MGEDEAPLLAVEPGYRHALRCRFGLVWLVIFLVALFVDRTFVAGSAFAGILSLIALVAAVAVVLLVPQRVYRRLRYRLSGQLLQVVRGWMFHTDTIVPLVRVQHLDVVRGPFDKLFGTATLVVHTAGTHNSIVSLPGLAPGRAAEMRDVIREHVRTDFA